MNLLSPEEVAACIVNTEPYALKDIDPEVLNHLIQYAAMLGAEKTNPKREWQGLTEDEVAQAMYRADAIITGPMQFKFAKEIEVKLKEKNT